jgi:hypothetical protein
MEAKYVNFFRENDGLMGSMNSYKHFHIEVPEIKKSFGIAQGEKQALADPILYCFGKGCKQHIHRSQISEYKIIGDIKIGKKTLDKLTGFF